MNVVCDGKVYVLRLGHRLQRDKRITTHCGLVSLALGASGIIITGDYDQRVLDSIVEAANRWNSGFTVRYDEDWRKAVSELKKLGCLIVHLTMYGVNLPFVLDGLRLALRKRGLAFIVGSEKVPRELYEISDLNVAVTHFPHSEVAALAIALKEVTALHFLTSNSGGRYRILPSHKGKTVVRL